MAAFTVLGLAGPAGAATGKVTHIKFHGAYVRADWVRTTASSLSETYINVEGSRFKTAGVGTASHINGKDRAATATGTYDGPFGPGEDACARGAWLASRNIANQFRKR